MNTETKKYIKKSLEDIGLEIDLETGNCSNVIVHYFGSLNTMERHSKLFSSSSAVPICLLDFSDKFVDPYLDDVLIYSKSFKDRVNYVILVLRQLKEHAVKMKAPKSLLFNRKVNFLGRIISSEGYQLNPY